MRVAADGAPTKSTRWSLNRLPRPVYWIAGALVGAAGALAARMLADTLDEVWRVPVWLAGGAAIFAGLAILSLGTRSRLEADGEASGAGEGNRTLV